MRRRFRVRATLAVIGCTILAALSLLAGPAVACGGLFCQNDPVNQAGERIVFTVNDDATITSLIEIQYQGSAPDFSWILPIPNAIEADDLAVPEDGDTVFDELHALTDVQILAPDTPECVEEFEFAAESTDESADAGVEVFATGEVGPFAFDVIGSEDPGALIGWLLDNDYRVEPPMEPLIEVYVEEQFAFIAMRLLEGETADSIQPIEITYEGTEPMIPLRLTAVAVMDNMPAWVWVFGAEQAVPANYEHMEIATEEITFFDFGGNDYNQLVSDRADALGGQAFITEFAGPSHSIELSNPYLQNLGRQFPYLTRLFTVISPEEMTVDPVFSLEAGRNDVSNVRDATQMTGLYSCERDGGSDRDGAVDSVALNPREESSGEVVATTPDPPTPGSGGGVGRSLLVGVVIGAVGAGAVGLILARKRPSSDRDTTI